MGEPLAQLHQPEHWQQIYNESIRAVRVNANEYWPIPPFNLPILCSSPLLFVLAENIDARPSWYLGCRLQQRVLAAISPGEVIGQFNRVPVNRPVLLRFPMYAAQYSLRCEVPNWFERLKLAVWEYSGPIVDSTEALISESTELIRVDLLRLEAKIDGDR